jgi:hypothetical protein
MEETNEWRLICAPGGWVRATDQDMKVYMRLRETGSGPAPRLNVHTVLMESETPISTAVWRQVPFEDIERFANDPRGILNDQPGGWNPPRTALLTPTEVEPIAIDDLERHFGTAEELAQHDAVSNPVPHPNGLFLTDWKPADPGERPERLTRPVGRITDDFLADLARSYQWLVAKGYTSPSTMLGEEMQTSVGNVRRWVSTARKKGLLPPGRPGRAG